MAEAEKGAKTHEKVEQLVVFKIGEESYAIQISQIQEVVITPPVAKVPKAPSYILGVANVRGNIVAVLDLAERFGLRPPGQAPLEVSEHKYTLVLESGQFKIGVLVKEVPGTLAVKVSDIDTSVNAVKYSNLEEECVKGIIKKDGLLIVLIDIMEMMRQDDARRAVS